MKEAKQPWPRSAKITVWVLGIIIAVSAIVNIITISQWYGPYQKWSDKCDSVKYLPIEELPKEEDIPVKTHTLTLEWQLESVFLEAFMTRMRPELEKKIFVYGPECRMTVSPVRFRKLPNGDRIAITRNGSMVYRGRLLTENGADLLEAHMQRYKAATSNPWRYGFLSK